MIPLSVDADCGVEDKMEAWVERRWVAQRSLEGRMKDKQYYLKKSWG